MQICKNTNKKALFTANYQSWCSMQCANVCSV